MIDVIRKEVVAQSVGDDPLVYVMSEETMDRVGDVIEAKGWQLDNFRKNPIALFGHDHKFIIGHWTDVRVKAGQLIGRLHLLPKGISERLDEIRAAVEVGVLRAVSVGFAPAPESIEPIESGGLRFRIAELMECSLVSVPAHPNALQMAKSLHLSDDAQSLIFSKSADPEIPADPTGLAAIGKTVRVVKLAPARARAPFVIASDWNRSR